jgi:hypothetical protein
MVPNPKNAHNNSISMYETPFSMSISANTRDHSLLTNSVLNITNNPEDFGKNNDKMI